MKTLYLKDRTDGAQGVRYHVSQIIGEASTDRGAPFHPSLLVRIPIFPFALCEAGTPDYYELPEPGVYEVIAEYWRGTPEQPSRRVYFYYACRDTGELKELWPGEPVLDEVNTTPYFRLVEHLDGTRGICVFEVSADVPGV